MAELVLPKKSYWLIGLLMEIHRKLGPIWKEINYQDAIEVIFKREKAHYEREKELAITFGDLKIKKFFIDFIVEDIVLEVKAENFIKQEDIRQVARYLKAAGLSLGIVANFKRHSLEYKRIINPECTK